MKYYVKHPNHYENLMWVLIFTLTTLFCLFMAIVCTEIILCAAFCLLAVTQIYLCNMAYKSFKDLYRCTLTFRYKYFDICKGNREETIIFDFDERTVNLN